MTQAPLDGKGESNPFRPDVPLELEQNWPDTFFYLREQAEVLRAQHNMTQVGDTTFNWSLLTQVTEKPLYTLGCLGRFYHVDYGIIRARYCQFQRQDAQLPVGVPYGRVAGDTTQLWQVTNDISKCNPDSILGLSAAYAKPKDGTYGWIIVDGPNLQSVTISAEEAWLEAGLVWASSGECGLGSQTDGIDFCRVVNPRLLSVVEGGKLEAKPGALQVRRKGDSKKRIRGWIEQGLSEVRAEIAPIEEAVARLAATVGPIPDSITALENWKVDLTQSLSLLSDNFALSIEGLATRINQLDKEALNNRSGVPVSVLQDITNLQNQVSTLRGVEEGGREAIQSNLHDLSSITSMSQDKLIRVFNTITTIADRISALKMSQVSDVPDSYEGFAGYILQVNEDETGFEFVDPLVLADIEIAPTDVTSIPLSSPWENYGGSFAPGVCYKTATGIVYLQGLVRIVGGGATTGVAVGTLPAGFRPGATHVFQVITNGGTWGRLDIDSAGLLYLYTGDTSWISLSGIHFLSA